MTKKRDTFLSGMLVLAFAGVVGKVIGAFYRVWLTNLITPEGISLYTMPYTVYNFLLVVASAGLPTAISKMVSARIAKGDRDGARTVFRAARRVLLITGTVCTLLMLALAKPIAVAMGDPAAAPAFLALAPAIFFVCLISSYRGYFQGMQRMTPTAASQLVEQIIKLAVGFPLASYLMQLGDAQTGIVYGAVGAICGVTLSEMFALALLMGAGARQRRLDRDLPTGKRPMKGVIPQLFASAVPITLGACMMPIVGLIDSGLVVNRLTDVGFVLSDARSMFGVLTGMVNSLVNMPAVVTIALSTSLVPAISRALTAGDSVGVQKVALRGVKLAVLIGLPAAVGMGMLAQPIIDLLYKSTELSQRVMGAQILQLIAAGIFFLSLVQTSTGILQGLGKAYIPVVTLGIGCVVKIVLNTVLVGNVDINIYGAPVASVACYLVAAIGNLWFVKKFSGARYPVVGLFIKPLIAVAGMAAALWAMGRFVQPHFGNTVYTMLAVAAGAGVYGVILLLIGGIDKEELLGLPGGRHLVRLLYRGK